MTDRALVVADAAGHILERLGRAWIDNGSSSRRQELVCSEHVHPYAIRRRGEAAGMIFWVDPLNFVRFPRAVRAPQCVMVHHITDPELPAFLAALPAADAVATSSVRWQQRLRELAGCEATLVPYVIDTRQFVPRDRAAARREIGIPDEAYVLGFSAKARADAFGRKGIDLFLETVSAAAARWRDIATLLIGAGWDALAGTLEDRGVRVFRREPARTEDTAVLYPAMDVFLCTSKEEGGPCTILEAMACEVPVITTDVGHVPEVVDDGANGFVVREREAAAWIAAIALLRDDGGRAGRIAVAGRDFVRARRDQRILSPQIPFDSMYAAADRRFRSRTRAEIASRFFSHAYLGGRYAVNRWRSR